MEFNRISRAFVLAGLISAPLGLASPQMVMAAPISAGRVEGSVRNALDQPLPNTRLQLQSADGRIVSQTTSDPNGNYTFTNVAPGTYAVMAEHAGFQSGTSIVTVTSGAGASSTIVLASPQALTVNVSGQRQQGPTRSGLSPQTGTSDYHLSRQDIQALPEGENTPLNQVLLQAPGTSQDSYGQVHVRGEHANLQYRVNGIMLPDAVTGFGQTLDTRFANQIDLLTGTLPAEFGERTAGVVDIHTKSGAFDKGGTVDIYGGSHDTIQPSIQYGGSSGSTNYYVTGSFNRNNLGIENPTPDYNAIHDRTEQGKVFGYASHLIDPNTKLSIMAGATDNRFQIPDQPGLSPSFQLDNITNYPSTAINENQTEKDRYGIIALQHSSGKFDYQISGFSRYGDIQFNPDPIGDLLYNGVASNVQHTIFSNGIQGDTTYRLNSNHTIRSGIYFNNEHATINNSSAVFPTDDQGNQSSTTPFTVTDNQSLSSNLVAAYVQDSWKVTPKLTFNYGLRADKMTGYINAGQLSPRANAVYQLTDKTTLHAGYARYFTPPPLEAVTPEDLALFQNTTNAPATNQSSPIKPERSNDFDIGITHRVTPAWQTGLDAYYKDKTDMLDEGQFGAALVFAPFNYKKGKIYGVEWTNAYKKGDLSAYFNLALSRSLAKQVESGEFNFGQDELDFIANNWIHTDHDQLVTASGGASYKWKGTTWGVDAIYGSGLRSGFANTGHLPGYLQVNLSASRPFTLPQVGTVTGRLAVINLFDKSYELRNGTGIGVFAPQFGPRRAIYAGLSKTF